MESKSPVVHRFANLANFRDIGGVKTANGQVLKTGVLFRSDELSRITEQDLAKLRELRIKLLCDLRSPEECQKKRTRTAPDGSLRVVNIPMHDRATQAKIRRQLVGCLFGKSGASRFREVSHAYYHHLAFERTAQVRQVLTLLAREENLPALIHCSAGKDRTGFVVAVIQLLVGVPHAAVMTEYLRTNDHFAPRIEGLIKVLRILTLFQVSPERMRLVLGTHSEFLQQALVNIVERHGSVEGYLREACEVDAQTLTNLKRALLA